MPAHRRLPHLRPFAQQPILFLTVVTHERCRVLACREVFETLGTIWQRSPELDGWFVGDYLLMPDRLHLFARAAVDGKSLAAWMETWKSLATRQLRKSIGIAPPLWQRDYFDRFLRSDENYNEKWDYVAMNPVRAGLCPRAADWPWKGRLSDLKF